MGGGGVGEIKDAIDDGPEGAGREPGDKVPLEELAIVDGATEFTMHEAFSGLMLPMIRGTLPDFGPPFERYAADLKRAAEANG